MAASAAIRTDLDLAFNFVNIAVVHQRMCTAVLQYDKRQELSVEPNPIDATLNGTTTL